MLTVSHTYGFFSFCSRLLEEIILYFNKHKQLPDGIDARGNLTWYKPNHRMHEDIFGEYFASRPEIQITYTDTIRFSNDDQYLDFKTLKYDELLPFVHKYFTPTSEIMQYVSDIESKYNLQDYSTICCLFYRGNDKITEMDIGPYEEFVARGKAVQEQNPNTLFLIQSDETQFLQRMTSEFPNHILLHEYMRHVPKCNSQVDKLNLGNNSNFLFSKYYVAITHVMSKCNTVICNSGNCAFWIAFFRGHANGMQQYLNGKWV